MLVNEINISTSMDNPNIVKLYEIYDFNNCIYLVYEYPSDNSVSAKEASFSTGSISKAV